MISYIKGQVILKKDKYVIVSTGNVGYKLFALSDSSKVGDTVEFFTYLNVREDSLALYGFSNYEDLELFEHLISVTGIGPKTALGVLSLADSRTIKIAIAKEDSSILTRVSGIGKKTAERIILELKNKFSISDADGSEEKGKEISDQSDAFDALVSLGYSSFQAKKALSDIPPEVKDVGEKIKMALKELGRK